MIAICVISRISTYSYESFSGLKPWPIDRKIGKWALLERQIYTVSVCNSYDLHLAILGVIALCLVPIGSPSKGQKVHRHQHLHTYDVEGVVVPPLKVKRHSDEQSIRIADDWSILPPALLLLGSCSHGTHGTQSLPQAVHERRDVGLVNIDLDRLGNQVLFVDMTLQDGDDDVPMLGD